MNWITRLSMFVVLLFVLLIVVALCSPNAAELKQIDTFIYHSGETITFAWSLGPEDDLARYEFQVLSFERGMIPVASGTIEGNPLDEDNPLATEATFTGEKVGHYIPRVRACDTSNLCSEWAESTDPNSAIVKETARGWWVYFYIAPPTGVTIEQQTTEGK